MRERLACLSLRLGPPIGVGLVLGLIGPFGTFNLMPTAPRLAYWLAVISVNWLLADAIVRRFDAVAGDRMPMRRLTVPFAGACLAAVPATGVVTLANGLSGIGWPDDVAVLFGRVLLLLAAIALPVYTWEDMQERIAAMPDPASSEGVPSNAPLSETETRQSSGEGLSLFAARLSAPLEGIARGEVTTAFRIWRRPKVKPAGRLRTAVGELVIEDLREVSRDDISEADSRAAGARGRAALLAELGDRPGRLYRIDFRLDRPDARSALAADDDLDVDAVAAISSALDRVDRRSRAGAWTRSVLDLIGRHPGRPAGELATEKGMDKPGFKRRVRSMKELGLTESLEIDYRLSPRGQRNLRDVAGRDGRQAEWGDKGGDVAITPFSPGDRQAVIDLAIAAWTPVFARTRHDVPRFVYDTFYPDGWEARQRTDVATLLENEPENTWLARRGKDPVGFIGIRIHAEDRMGEIYILAVSPEHQRKGIGRRLMQFAEDRIRSAGMQMIMVETIGDSGHEPARRAYETFGFQRWPVARYFKDI